MAAFANTNYLFYEVFKARFFPNCTIMEARNSRAGSYAGISILHGRDVLLKGCKWQIGNGKLVGIWQDFWLPQRHTPQDRSTLIESLADAKVDMLIDDSNR